MNPVPASENVSAIEGDVVEEFFVFDGAHEAVVGQGTGEGERISQDVPVTAEELNKQERARGLWRGRLCIQMEWRSWGAKEISR